MPALLTPCWLPGGHAQTIWSALYARRAPGPGPWRAPQWRRERWQSPDADFVDVDFSLPEGERAAPLLVLWHGLEGSSSSHYAQALACVTAQHGWSLAVVHFRGCSGRPNRTARAYHAADTAEVDWVMRGMRQRAMGPLLAVGVSLGGNVLVHWAARQGAALKDWVQAVAAISAPLDMCAAGAALGEYWNRQLYGRMFLRSLVPKALAKWQQFPGLFDKQALLAVQDLQAFDNVFTAPVHGFVDAQDYWSQASAKPWLGGMGIACLLLNARNDPLVPAASLPGRHEVSDTVTLWQPPTGGHVGFAQGRWPGHVLAMPQALVQWMGPQISGDAVAAAMQERAM